MKIGTAAALLGFVIVSGCLGSGASRRGVDNLSKDVVRLTRENVVLRERLRQAEIVQMTLMEAAKEQAAKLDELELRVSLAAPTGAATTPAASASVATTTSRLETGNWKSGGFTDWKGSSGPAVPNVASSSSEATRQQPQSTTAVTNDEVIREYCAKEWGTNYRMVAYCQSTQVEAKQALDARTYNPGISGNDFSGIRSGCRQEWPGNYRMQDYCETQQIQAYKQVR